MATSIHVFDDKGHWECESLEAIPDLAAQPNITVWIDTDEHGPKIEGLLRDRFNVHPLAIEDIFESRLTPKIEEYEHYLYLVMHGVRRDAESPEDLGTIEIDIVMGQNWIFTHHDLPMRSVETLKSELARNPRLLQKGPVYVAHAIIDNLIGHYLPVVDKFEEEIDEIEQNVINNPRPEILQRIFAVKRSLQRLRRISVHQRDTLMRLSRGEFELVPEKTLHFFRDVYDHFVRIADLADSYRELVSMSLDIYMSVLANRTNDIMKTLALFSTIMMPLTFIAGVYGMNFEHMPELKWLWGYPSALGLMAVVAISLYVWFRRKRWF